MHELDNGESWTMGVGAQCALDSDLELEMDGLDNIRCRQRHDTESWCWNWMPELER